MPATSNVTSSVMMTMDEEEMSPEARQCVATLREGKRCCPVLGLIGPEAVAARPAGARMHTERCSKAWG